MIMKKQKGRKRVTVQLSSKLEMPGKPDGEDEGHDGRDATETVEAKHELL